MVLQEIALYAMSKYVNLPALGRCHPYFDVYKCMKNATKYHAHLEIFPFIHMHHFHVIDNNCKEVMEYLTYVEIYYFCVYENHMYFYQYY